MLRQIEKLTRQKIEIATLPTVADLNARRLDITRAALREALAAGGLDRYRTVVKALAEEFEILDVAAAAVKLAHEPADGAAAEEADRPRRFRAGPRARAPGIGMARVFVGAGRTAGVRPKDLVGAITKGAGVAAAALGAIQIGDRSSVVEVRASEAKALIDGAAQDAAARQEGPRPPVRRAIESGGIRAKMPCT